MLCDQLAGNCCQPIFCERAFHEAFEMKMGKIINKECINKEERKLQTTFSRDDSTCCSWLYRNLNDNQHSQLEVKTLPRRHSSFSFHASTAICFETIGMSFLSPPLCVLWKAKHLIKHPHYQMLFIEIVLEFNYVLSAWICSESLVYHA